MVRACLMPPPGYINAMSKTGQNVNEFISDYFKLVRAGRVKTFAPLLPLFKLSGETLSTNLHFQLEPMFKFEQPRQTVYMCSRQVGKSSGITASAIIRGHWHPGFHTLIVEPRGDQLKRFNHTILRPMLKGCLIRDQIINGQELAAFYVKELNSGSLIYLEFAFLDADRLRGIAGVSNCVVDEAQDVDYDHLPVIRETMTASRRHGYSQYTGTPKTTDGTLGILWNDSSQAEWCIPCGCRKKNIPCASQDLFKMIGKTTCICAKCGKPLDARRGYYVHAMPAKASTFAGYHFSQVTHPLHYGIPAKWFDLTSKMENYPKAKFYNEVLGIPCDESVKLLCQQDLITASSKVPGTREWLLEHRRNYDGVVLGVDWSGGGDMDASYTSVAAVGFRQGTDVVDNLYCERIPLGQTPEQEAQYVMQLMRDFQCVYMAHDYGGAGYIRESLMRQAGLPDHQIIPMTYVCSTRKEVITYNPPGAGLRFSYSIDKARSLAVLCTMIRSGKITLPDYNKNRQVVDDLLNLIEMPKELPRGDMIYLIGRVPKKPDDYAHALNFACSAIWYTRQAYPNMATSDKFKIGDEQYQLMNVRSADKTKWSQ